jgi:hypothetical protein
MSKHFLRMMMIIACVLLLTGCGDSTKSQVSMDQYPAPVASGEETPDPEEELEDVQTEDGEIYLVVSIDTDNCLIDLAATDSARVIQYGYTLSTRIMDAYGQYISAEKLTPGRAVTIGDTDSEAKLTSIQLAADAWYQENITRFSIDDSIGMLTIGDSKYRYGDHLRVFADDQEISISQIKEGDVLSVQGLDKQILSVQVTRGHGTIALVNTELFEGGWISLGTKIYAKITENMILEVPEGTYELSVANDGYGDTKEIQVERASVTTVDLEEYRGEEPKVCQVTFEIYVDGAELYIDGEPVDYDQPVELRYGVYSLMVIAEGFETWQRQLVIHSADATIQIGEPELSGEDATEETDGSQIIGDVTDADDETDSSADTDSETGTDSSTGDSSLDNTGDYGEYLDTLVDLINSLNSTDSSSN